MIYIYIYQDHGVMSSEKYCRLSTEAMSLSLEQVKIF